MLHIIKVSLLNARHLLSLSLLCSNVLHTKRKTESIGLNLCSKMIRRDSLALEKFYAVLFKISNCSQVKIETALDLSYVLMLVPVGA